jgi:hypothetical protein
MKSTLHAAILYEQKILYLFRCCHLFFNRYVVYKVYIGSCQESRMANPTELGMAYIRFEVVNMSKTYSITIIILYNG